MKEQHWYAITAVSLKENVSVATVRLFSHCKTMLHRVSF